MDVIVERAAALDVHKEQVTACVRVPGPGGVRSEEVTQFQTTVRGLLTLHDWLAAHGVAQLAMEALLNGLGRGPWGHDLIRLGRDAVGSGNSEAWSRSA